MRGGILHHETSAQTQLDQTAEQCQNIVPNIVPFLSLLFLPLRGTLPTVLEAVFLFYGLQHLTKKQDSVQVAQLSLVKHLCPSVADAPCVVKDDSPAWVLGCRTQHHFPSMNGTPGLHVAVLLCTS